MAESTIFDSQYETDDELELLGPLIVPDFQMETDMLDGLSEVDSNVSDNDLRDALEAIEASQQLVADDANDNDDNQETNSFENSVTSGNESSTVIEPVVTTSTCSTSRFASLNEEDKENIISETESVATKRQTKYGVNIFRQWLKETKREVNFEEFSTDKLDKNLRDFYAEVKGTDGQLYSKSTFVGIRASISRYLRAHPFNKPFSLMTDKDFHKSNQMFLAMIKILKREGLDVTKHHPSISEGDLEKLRLSGVLSTDNPKGLLRKVWFDIVLGFGRRGRENQRNFKDTTFKISHDDRGFKFIEMNESETTKNHRGGLTDDDFEKSPRIYATNTDGCPVSSFESYVAHRNPNSTHFFQLPLKKIKPTDDIWYTTRPYGGRMLNDMMKGISKDALLSKVYTNHCVRATTINVLSHSGISDREIMKITGHRSEASLSSYNADSSDQQKRKYSSILQGVKLDDPQPSKKSASTNVQQQQSSTSSHTHGQCQPIMACQQNIMQHITNITNLPVTPNPIFNYNKQFEVTNSTVNVYNYHINK